MRRLWSGRAAWLLAVLVLAGTAATYLYTLDEGSVEGIRAFFLAPGSNVLAFLLALLILPLSGLPITAFCLMAGAKFGIVWGSLAIGGAMLAHQLTCFWLMHSLFGDRLRRLMDRRSYRVPVLSQAQQLTWGVSMVAVPVIPYMVKNVLLAAGQLSLWQYLLIAWPIQMLFSVPLVALTGAARDQNATLVWAAAAVFIALWLAFRWLYWRSKATLGTGGDG